MKSFLFAIAFLHVIILSLGQNLNEPDFWRGLAKDFLQDSRKSIGDDSVKKAKNVIFFLGDGMGMPTISAARLLKRQNNKNQMDYLAFEKFDHVALIKTYNLDFPVPDSAGTGTAFCTGVKTNRGILGVNGYVKQNSNCDLIEKNTVTTVYEKSFKAGKSVGVVTTASVTDATPAATYAHVSSRYNENSVPWNDTSKCKDIARQLIEDHNYHVVLGGGLRNFLPKSNGGKRKDGLDLLEKWKENKNKTSDSSKFQLVRSRQELLNISDDVEYLFGVFSDNHMKFDKERKEDSPEESEPSLEEMTERAIKILQKNPKGFLLMVEGAKIDKAHHTNQAYYSLYDVMAFEKAIIKALKMVDLDETLVMVTADHSHSFTHSGGARSGDNIFEFATYLDDDKINFTPLIYSTGPGYRKERKNQTKGEVTKPDYKQLSAVNLESATHGGDDVAVYATGPGSNLLKGSQEQSTLAHLIEFSSCVGDYDNEIHCNVNFADGLSPRHFLISTIAIVYWIGSHLILFS